MARTSIIGILVNLAIAAAKILLGMAVASLAIISEGINNATDALSAVLTLVGTKLSGKHPDEKHPFGYGRIEYLTGMAVGIIILYAGLSTFRESVAGIIHPAPLSVDVISIVIIAGTAVIKFILGLYTIKMGKKVNSDTLIAVGEDSRNDSFISVVTIVTSIIYLVAHISLDAYAGVLFSFIVLKSGFEALKNTSSDIIGSAGDEELASKIYKEVRATKGVINAADMMLHNYGPGRFSGSVNVEIDHKETVGSVYEVLHELQLKIMHEYQVVMVFGIYAIDRDTPEYKKTRQIILDFVKPQEHIKSIHALFLSKETNTIYVDFIVDYKLKDWDELRNQFTSYMKEHYPDQSLELTIETEFV